MIREKLGTSNSGQADYFSLMATVEDISADRALYKGCPNEINAKTCNKKVMPVLK